MKEFMSKKRIKLTTKQYEEIVQSLNWARQKDFVGMVSYYEESLDYLAKRKALPNQPSETNDDVTDDSQNNL